MTTYKNLYDTMRRMYEIVPEVPPHTISNHMGGSRPKHVFGSPKKNIYLCGNVKVFSEKLENCYERITGVFK